LTVDQYTVCHASRELLEPVDGISVKLLDNTVSIC